MDLYRVPLTAIDDAFAVDSTLLHQLPLDAVLARADSGELVDCIPRLCALCVGNELGETSPVDIFDRIGGVWPELDGPQRGSVFELLTLWWQASLGLYPSDPNPSRVLASLARLPLPLSHWLEFWLTDLDESPAAHMADLVLRDIDSTDWTTVPDTRGQVIGWLKSEPVVNGLAFVAGVHLDDGQLGLILDRLIDGSVQ